MSGKKKEQRNNITRMLSVILTLVMVASSIISAPVTVYAKDVGHKNEQACDDCEMVIKGWAPSLRDFSSYVAGRHTLDDTKQGLSYSTSGDSNGYSTTEETYATVISGAVYRGGNSDSGLQPKNPNATPETNPDRKPTLFDADPNDFASVLPYGNTYIDTNSLRWTASNIENFTIDIQDDRFKWIAGETYAGLTDSTKTTEVNTDPLGDGRGLATNTNPVIAYIGPVKGYLGNDRDAYVSKSQASPVSGQENVIVPQAGADYLYQITYKDAATLKDGTKGNLVITVTRVEIETTATQDKALITLQGANEIDLGADLKDKNGNYFNTQKYVAKTEDEMRQWLDGTPLQNSGGWTMDKSTGTATGAIIDMDFKVTDSAGNPVDGSISYAARDMDLENYQDLWGRSSDGEDKYKFNEAMTIVDGALSYAVTPYYDHANATTRAEGWIPVRPGSTEEYDSPLHITKTGSSSYANGVRFSGMGNVVMRDKNGTFQESIIAWGSTADTGEDVRTSLYVNHRNADTLSKGINTLTIPDNVKKQLVGKIKDAGGNNVAWNQMTNEQIFDYLGAGSYGYRRGDNGTYDTGFAVLLNATKSKFQWSGSMHNGGDVHTTLFDTSIYTYIEQTHGTGGGIYFETYDIADSCKVNRSEGTVTMGRGTDATVTVVPEDGYRVDTIQIGAKTLGSPSTFTPIYDNSGTVTKIKDNAGTEHDLTGGKVTITDTAYGPITFEVNDGGSIDVTLPSVQDPRHIHADFTADYYFYKVWKSKEQEPTSLKLTATPYAYKFKEVEIDGVKYTISGNTFTNTVTEQSYTLENNALKIGEDPNITVYYLEGNDLVSYKYTDPTDPDSKTEDGRYTIRLEYEKNGDPVKFDVVKADADNPSETNVIATTDADGYPVWKIRYPAEGYKTKNHVVWPALPIETTPSAHNINHVERNYWFVTEDAPGWALVEYDNSKAEAPGVIDAAKDRNEIYKVGTGKADEDTTTSNYSSWALTSTKDYQNSGAVIKHASSSDHAYMSVFSDHASAITKHTGTWGGKIVNIPLVVVNAEKTWDDFSNAFNTRQDVWFHIDATIEGKKTTDILPPQKLAATESGDKFTKTWGNKAAYGDSYLSEYKETGVDYSKVKVVGTTSDLPKDIYYAQDNNNPHKYIPMIEDGYEEVGGVQVPKYKQNDDGTVYYVNELSGVDGDGKVITYSLRETDAEGNELNKSDESEYLIGYKSEVSEVNVDTETVTLNGVGVTSYTGKVKNTLETVDFEVTKIWKENGASRTHTLEADAAKLKAAFTLNESDEKIADTDELKLQPSTAEAYVADPESGTLEIKNGTDETEVVFTWHSIPKYIGEDDGEGNITVREAKYSVVETPLSGYNAPTYSGEGKAEDKGTITNEVTPPEGTPKETYGAKNTPQTADGKSMFTVTTQTTVDGSTNTIDKIELLDAAGNPATEVTVEGGKYTIDDSGKITFTPDTDFVGDPPAVTVRGTDKNGLTATTTYTPHVVDNEKTVKRTITYEYSNGDPVLDEGGQPKTVVHETTFVGTVDPNTGTVTWNGIKDPTSDTVTPMDTPSSEFPQVDSGAIDGYTVDKDKVDKKTVTPADSDWEEKVIYSPKDITPTPYETYNLPNTDQSGKVTFTMETETYTDGTPNTITMKLIDPKTGKETDSKTVDAVDDDGNTVGTYTLSDDGTVTFTPNKDYVGNPKPAEIMGTDRFGVKAKTTYTPHIVDPTSQDVARRTIHYTYLTDDGETVTEDVVQELTLTRHASKVNPETGEVEEWGPWEPQTFPAVDNPDDQLKNDGVSNFGDKTWSTDDSATQLEVTEPGDKGVQNIVYVKEPYTVIYHDGDHGTSDGGDQEGEDYNNEVTGGNTVTPSKGYKFTGTYSYVIKDKDGNIIGSGTTDDPKSLKVTGNIEFTPVYEKLPTYNINYDKNGGTGTMDDDNYASDDPTMPYDENTFTRKGYHFTGFHAYIKNPETGEETHILDENGDPIVFTGSEDMSEYFKDMPDRTSIRMEAQWKPDSYKIKYDANGGSGTMETQTISGADGVANSKTNEFTRKGYTFKGFKAVLPDGSTLKDEAGNELVFENAKDFFDYLAEAGDGAEVMLVAQWEPEPEPEPEPQPEPEPEPEPQPEPEPEPEPQPEPEPEPEPQPEPQPQPQPEPQPQDPKTPAADTGDENNIALWLAIMAVGFAGVLLVSRKLNK